MCKPLKGDPARGEAAEERTRCASSSFLQRDHPDPQGRIRKHNQGMDLGHKKILDKQGRDVIMSLFY